MFVIDKDYSREEIHSTCGGNRNAGMSRDRFEQTLVPIRSFIDDQMVENILVVLKIELAADNGGREPSTDEIATFLRECKPARLLRTIRMHSTMRGLESLTKSDHQVLRWCAMLSRLLQ